MTSAWCKVITTMRPNTALRRRFCCNIIHVVECASDAAGQHKSAIASLRNMITIKICLRICIRIYVSLQLEDKTEIEGLRPWYDAAVTTCGSGHHLQQRSPPAEAVTTCSSSHHLQQHSATSAAKCTVAERTPWMLFWRWLLLRVHHVWVSLQHITKL